jgi:WD40 repeat protein
MWDQHDRSEDLLWTGTAFREFQLWREHYPGGLSAQEEAFAGAMVANATRQRRRRRFAVTAVITLALGVAAVMTSLWRRSEDETLRAEAGKLLALAQLRHEEDPTEALAYTTASLELADTEEARVFALRLLWEAPPALEMVPEGSNNRLPKFSPDGSRLAASGHTEEVRVWTAEGGDPPLVLPGHQPTLRSECGAAWASNELLVTSDGGWPTRRCYVWRFPEGERVRTIDFGGESFWQVGPDTLFAKTQEGVPGRQALRLRSWRLPDAEPQELGRVDLRLAPFGGEFVPNGRGWLYAKGGSVYLRPLPARSSRGDRLLGRHSTKVTALWPLWDDPVQVYSGDQAGEIRIWDFSHDEPKLAKVIPRQEGEPQRVPDPSGRWALSSLAHAAGAIGSLGSGRQARVWNLDAWPEARPLTLRRSGSWDGAISAFHPRGDWLVISTRALTRLTFWPLRGDRPRVVDSYSILRRPLAFSPDGQWLATSWGEEGAPADMLRLWPLPGSGSREVKGLALPERNLWRRLAFDQQGRFLFVVGYGGRAYVVPLDGLPPRRLEGFSDDTSLRGAAVSPSGRRVATAFSFGQGSRTLRVWDLETGELRLFDLPEGSSWGVYELGIHDLAFADESALYTAGDGGVRRWNLETGAHELVFPTKPGHMASMALAPDGRTALVHETPFGGPATSQPIRILDLVTSVARALPAFGERFLYGRRLPIAIDASGAVAASGDEEGIVRVGRVSEEEPHLLVGHEGPVDFVTISPDRRWVASSGEDDTLRLWPMPDLSKPPLHTLPHDDLIAKLKSLTNFRVVRDPESAQGWKVDLDPFPGWEEIPVWQ